MSRRVVVFDLGMVLSTPAGLYDDLARVLQVTSAQVEQVFWRHRHPYDEGLGDREYWARTVAELGTGAELDDATLAELVAVDVGAWRSPRPEARRILADLRTAGVETAILSNAPSSFAAAAPDFDWHDQIGTWFFSGPLGMAKPAAAIYETVERDLHAAPADLWFVDDKQVNVDAATARGWHAHLWVDDADTRAWLTAEGFLPGS